MTHLHNLADIRVRHGIRLAMKDGFPIPPRVAVESSVEDRLVADRWHDLDYVASIALGVIEDKVISKWSAMARMLSRHYTPALYLFGELGSTNCPRSSGPGVDGLPDLVGSDKQVAYAQDLRAVAQGLDPSDENLTVQTDANFWITHYRRCQYKPTGPQMEAEKDRAVTVKRQLEERAEMVAARSEAEYLVRKAKDFNDWHTKQEAKQARALARKIAVGFDDLP